MVVFVLYACVFFFYGNRTLAPAARRAAPDTILSLSRQLHAGNALATLRWENETLCVELADGQQFRISLADALMPPDIFERRVAALQRELGIDNPKNKATR